MPKLVPHIPDGDWVALRRGLNKLASVKLGPGASPTYAGLTLNGLTASTLIGANASKLLESVTIGTGLDYTRPTLSLSHLGIEALADPGADRIFFWDDNTTAAGWLVTGNSIVITTTTIDTIQDIRTSASPTFAGVGIGTTTIPHGGVGWAKFAMDGANKSSDAGSNYAIFKVSDSFKIMYDSGVARGGAVTWNEGIVLNTSGLVTFGGAINITTVAAEGSDVDKFLVDSSGVVKYRTGTQVLSDIGGSASGHNHSGVYEPTSAALTDLTNVGIVTGDSYFLVGTGSGALAWETTTTVRTSLGLGTGDSPQFAKLGVGVAAPASGLLKIYDATINTTTTYLGFYNYHEKIAGVTDVSDDFYGIYNIAHYNQSGGVIGVGYGIRNIFKITDGDMGSAGNTRSLAAIHNLTDLDGGKIYGDVYGLKFEIDQEAANEVTGNIYGNYIDIDADGTVGGSVYGLYLNEGSNVDYGIYQNGSAPNVFGGNLIIADGGTIGQAAGPLLTFDDTNNFLEITGCKIGHGTATPNVIASWTAPATAVIYNLYGGANQARFAVQGGGAAAAQFDLVDLDGAVNAKWFNFKVDAGVGKLGSLADDGSAWIHENILACELSTGNVSLGKNDPKTRLTVEGTITLKEQAAADGDTPTYGQLWVKNTNPCELWFTDDAGLDTQIV